MRRRSSSTTVKTFTPPIPRANSPFDISLEWGNSTRDAVRRYLHKLILLETPTLINHQQKWRSPKWDWLMMHVSLLGTHTFFLSFLPILFWFPRDLDSERMTLLASSVGAFGRTMVVLLCMGVYVTGYFKDLLALPRPGSAVEKLTLTHSVTLEYGFPSTHSANAVSIALASMYFAWYSWYPLGFLSSTGAWILSIIVLIQAIAVCYSRIYCGMHSITDVVGGVVTGIGLTVGWLMQWQPGYESFIKNGISSYSVFIIYALLAAALPLMAFPDPLHPCPCFEDAVCFIGVVIGVSLAGMISGEAVSSKILFPGGFVQGTSIGMTPLQVLVSILVKLPVGLILIFLTRFTLKKLCFKILPPIFGYFNLSTSTAGLIHYDLAKFHREPPHKHVTDKGIEVLCNKYHIPRLTVDNVTKVIVYTGIGLMATYICPFVVFPRIGL